MGRRKKKIILYCAERANKRNNRLHPATTVPVVTRLHPVHHSRVIECCDSIPDRLQTVHTARSPHGRIVVVLIHLFAVSPSLVHPTAARAANSFATDNPWANLSNARATRLPSQAQALPPLVCSHLSFPLTYYNIFNNPTRPQKRDPSAYSSYH